MIHIKRDYFWVGTSQNVSTKHPETSPENSITFDPETIKDHVTEGPGTTEDYTTPDPGTTEDYTTPDPGTTEDYTTPDLGTTEDYTTEHPDTKPEGTDSVTAVKPPGLLTPIRIPFISLATTATTVALFVGFGFLVVSTWLWNVQDIMEIRAPEEDEVGKGSWGIRNCQRRGNVHRESSAKTQRHTEMERKGARSIKIEGRTEGQRKVWETEGKGERREGKDSMERDKADRKRSIKTQI